MPTTTWQAIRREMMREMGFFLFTTITGYTGNNADVISNATSEGVRVLSPDLAAKYPKADYFNDWYCLLLGTTSKNGTIVRRVADYQITGGLLLAPTANQNLTGETGNFNCELHVFDPDQSKEYFNRARQDLFPGIPILRDHQGMITGQHQRQYTLPSTLRGGPLSIWLGERTPVVDLAENVFSNGGFENWTNSTTPTSWTLVGTDSTVTQEKETTNPKNYAVLEGANSARLVAATALTTLLQAVDLSASDKIGTEGMEVNTSIWVYCLTASRVRAQISGTNVASTPVYSSYHLGTGWEKLTVSANLTSAATGYDSGVAIAAGGALAVFVDEALSTVGQSEIRTDRWEPVDNWTWLPPIGGAANGGILEFPEPLIEKRPLRILGRDLLSSVTAETDTVEASGEQLDLLYNKVREYLCRDRLSKAVLPEDVAYWSGRADYYQGRVEAGLNGSASIPTPKRRWKIPDE